MAIKIHRVAEKYKNETKTNNVEHFFSVVNTNTGRRSNTQIAILTL